jgi:hypothetical protein
MSLSPEIFISDDHIVNTQESVEAEMNVSSKTDELQGIDGTSVPIPMKDPVVTSHQTLEMRRSERLKKDISLTTMEKNERMTKKRNLEGNTTQHNSFSALPIDDIVNITANMGVIVDENDSDTFDLLKE